MILSILTCTLPERARLLKRLSDQVLKQIQGKDVEFLIDPRQRHIPTGQKRNDLIKQSKGQWVCFVDDDDIISDNYVSLILGALNSNPDVVTFDGWMLTDGKFTANWVIKLGERWEDRGGVYYRFPNHLCPIRKIIAERFPFDRIYQQEDYKFALSLRNSGSLKTEVHIPEKIYCYDFRTNKK